MSGTFKNSVIDKNKFSEEIERIVKRRVSQWPMFGFDTNSADSQSLCSD